MENNRVNSQIKNLANFYILNIISALIYNRLYLKIPFLIFLFTLFDNIYLHLSYNTISDLLKLNIGSLFNTLYLD